MSNSSRPSRLSTRLHGIAAVGFSLPGTVAGAYVLCLDTIARTQTALASGAAVVPDMSDTYKFILVLTLLGAGGTIMGLYTLASLRKTDAPRRELPERARRFSAAEPERTTKASAKTPDAGGTIHPDDIRYASLMPRDQWPDLSRVLPE